MPYCVKNQLKWEDLEKDALVGETLFYLIPEDLHQHCTIYGDDSPYCLDKDFADERFGGLIAPPSAQNMYGHFFFILKLGAQKLTYDITMHSYGKYEWYQPVRVGDLLNARMYVAEKFKKRDKRYLTWRIEVFNHRGEPVSTKWHRSNWPDLPADEMIALGAVERGVASKEFGKLAEELIKRPYYEDKVYARWVTERGIREPAAAITTLEELKGRGVPVMPHLLGPDVPSVTSQYAGRWDNPLKWEDIQIGDEITPLSYRESYDRMYSMCMFYGDFFSWHITEVVARKSPFRSKQIGQGLMAENFPSQAVVKWLGTPLPLLNGGGGEFWLMAPSYNGDVITCTGKVADKEVQDGKRYVHLEISEKNQDGGEICRGSVKLCFD